MRSIWLPALALVVLVTTAALADPSVDAQPSLGLRWNDPNLLAPTTEREFDAQLATRLGRPAFVAGADDPTLSVTWQGTAEHCRVELFLTRAKAVEGTRVIESPSGDCQALVPALLTVSALLVESYESEQAADAAPPSPAPPAPPRASPEAAPRHPPPRSEARALLSLGGALSSGFVPKLEIGPAAAVTWAPVRPVRVGVAASWFIGHDYGERPGLSLSHQRATLLVCGMPRSGDLGVGLCGNVGLQHFHATGTSLAHSDDRSVATWSVGAELRAEWRLTRRWWWVGQVGADVAAHPLYFYYLAADGRPKNLFEQRRVNPVLLLALSLELP